MTQSAEPLCVSCQRSLRSKCQQIPAHQNVYIYGMLRRLTIIMKRTALHDKRTSVKRVTNAKTMLNSTIEHLAQHADNSKFPHWTYPVQQR